MTLHVESTQKERKLRIGLHSWDFPEEKHVSVTIFIGMVLKIVWFGLGNVCFMQTRRKKEKQRKNKKHRKGNGTKELSAENTFYPATPLMYLWLVFAERDQVSMDRFCYLTLIRWYLINCPIVSHLVTLLSCTS